MKQSLKQAYYNVKFQELICELQDRSYYDDLTGFLKASDEAKELIRNIHNDIGVRIANVYREKLNQNYNEYITDLV
jgi:hypothetical protein